MFQSMRKPLGVASSVVISGLIIVFFGFHLIGLALLNLVIILTFIIILMKEYFSKDKMSFYLMVPYLAWSSYALILNSSIFLLN